MGAPVYGIKKLSFLENGDFALGGSINWDWSAVIKNTDTEYLTVIGSFPPYVIRVRKM